MSGTLPETNIAPENRPSEKEHSIPTIHVQVQTVSFREGIYVFMWASNSSIAGWYQKVTF